MSIQITGTIAKMRASLLDGAVQYRLPVGEEEVELNALIGQTLTLTHTGNIFCCSCGKKTKKSYSQGHCFVCMKKLASCDMCIMKPETCHFAEGTCREPQWGEANCFVDHYVYLSNTSSLKVGITRHTQIPTRWIDQGATQGLPIAKVKNRLISGLVEIELAKLIADKTNWRTLLKGNNEPLALKEAALELLPQVEEAIAKIQAEHGEDSVELLDENILDIAFPINEFPTKIVSHNFDKNPEVTGVLNGIKGQYLLFDTGVINIRKFGSYEVTVTA
ncbi:MULTISPECIES: DUF2797 domain-containing protein [Aliivibrio]|uniref:DUF2797 domain-containing protein n=1 Tax=Aliivibrio finisterrensis TaxID=511998 RepID=A0A4Q5KWL7_9GAMM|nr:MULTISPECIES: DUF2797 domain-containing protein [Aliivibrio]MDD9178464.1 DUF2797 domain-containing protein [Aliivibrio sp. A6]RYU52962.1 DUF2797 domain-containing protein [Aliivibrio finisterrensis]RYU53358.1 DUF2797 domain-containing protein [Aliivibrio finisterrensis]RYU58446.1 DUF2797 domain-containing protein [Aliivibrio finisterrensis]RYU65864.1 DUF2797 domain-containing protein [Aliivibrio finisterrensis]